jgi:hypothetical protein
LGSLASSNIYLQSLCSLFNHNVSISDCVVLHDWMVVNNELGRMWNEAVLV